jgi:hypothetical protein
MRGVKIKKSVSITLTANDWQLYAAADEDGREINPEFVAVALNNAIERDINSGLSIFEVEKNIHNVMSFFADFGATDSEPREVLYSMLNSIYGDME